MTGGVSVFKPGRRPSDSSGMDTTLTLNVSDLDSDMDDAGSLTHTSKSNNHVKVGKDIDTVNTSNKDNNDDDSRRIAALLAALAFVVTPEPVVVKEVAEDVAQSGPVTPPRTPVNQRLDQSNGSSRSSNSCNDIEALQEKLTRMQKKLRFAIAEKGEFEERCIKQEQQIEKLVGEIEAQRARETLARRAIATLEQQVVALRNQQRSSGDDTSSSTQLDNNRSDHGDCQVRDQIAAVKASLEQGSHQAKVNKESLDEDLETFDRLRQKLATRKDAHEVASTPTDRPRKSKRQSQRKTASIIKEEGRINQESILQELATCRHLVQELAKRRSVEVAQTKTPPVATNLSQQQAQTIDEQVASVATNLSQQQAQTIDEQVASLVASVQERNEALYQAEIELWKKALLDLANCEES